VILGKSIKKIMERLKMMISKILLIPVVCTLIGEDGTINE